MEFIQNAFWILVSFLIGSIPTGYLIAKQVRSIDIREHGSGNVGATNVFRVIGKSWGLGVLAIDIFKGWFVTALLASTSNAFSDLSPAITQFLFGAAAIAGHTWSPWLKLKGGKGVATSCGALLGIFPFATFIALLIWSAVFIIWRYVSLASISAALSYPLLLILFYRDRESFGMIFLISLALVGLLIYTHKTNIERLKRGEELKISFGKKKDSTSSQT